MKNTPDSPREYLRKRRPEKFADSDIIDVPILDRSTLEYHLSTLTNRGQELDFEIFARHLAQREICPNLINPTGPSGGGDGKVDSETYPLADELSLVWSTGIGTQAASEKWAFAFSAKEDWAPKLRSDIKKLVGTQRGYKKAFFITNQFVPNKKRSDAQDKLIKEHSLDVVILDRTWILDRVFENKHELLAIDDLKISAEVRPLVKKGPQDLTNESLLNDVETRIKAAINDGKCGSNLAEDCIEAALLTRSLERPRVEVEGLFERAERVAAQHGTAHQRLQCAYDRASTSYWWYEDYHTFLRFYEQVEGMAKDSTSAHDLELLTNLWLLLHSAVVRQVLEPEEAKITERASALTSALDRLSSESEQPSNSLQARTLRLMMDLMSRSPKSVSKAFVELQEVVRQSEGLVGYPFERLSEEISELGVFFNDIPEYGDLFEVVVEIMSKRKGEVSAARMLLTRGTQQLDKEKPYEAIRLLGRALNRLFKHESRQDLVRALYACSKAYQCVGLLWAARGTLLTAASLSAIDYRQHHEFTKSQAVCYREMKWVELYLGRIVQTLAWSDVERLVSTVLVCSADEQERIAQDAKDYDSALGVLLLRSDYTQLHRLSALPDGLAKSNLLFSSSALLFALGHEELMSEWELPEGIDDVNAFFSHWCNHLSTSDLPPAPVLGDGTDIHLVSRILGCTFLLKCPNASPYLELGESFLAALESLMATGMADRIVAQENQICLDIQRGYEGDDYFKYAVNENDGNLRFDIRCSQFDANSLTSAAQQVIKDRIMNLLVKVMTRVFVFGDDPENSIRRLIRDDRACERALNFTSSFVTIGNVLGHSRETDISSLCGDAERYEVKRTTAWVATLGKGVAGSVAHTVAPSLGETAAPQGLPPSDTLKHTDVIAVSLIKDVLWDQAGWNGVAFALDPNASAPPVLALRFQNKTAAEKIFHYLKEELGSVDEKECLRVSIVRGIDKDNPYAYRVVVGANPSICLDGTKKQAFLKCRQHVMEPSSDYGLTTFLKEYRRAGAYLFGYAVDIQAGQSLNIGSDALIMKKELYVKEACDINKHDIDSVAIHPEDKPFVSKNMPLPPA